MTFDLKTELFDSLKLFNIADYGGCDVRTYGKALGMDQEICDWLDEHPHSLMIRYGSDKKPNDHCWVELTIFNESDAMLFKLTWL